MCDLGSWSLHFSNNSESIQNLGLIFRPLNHYDLINAKKILYISLIKSQPDLLLYRAVLIWRTPLKEINDKRLHLSLVTIIQILNILVNFNLLPIMMSGTQWHYFTSSHSRLIILILPVIGLCRHPKLLIMFNSVTPCHIRLKISFLFYFSYRFSRLWNSSNTLKLSNLSAIKLHFSLILKMSSYHFIANFDSDNPCTFYFCLSLYHVFRYQLLPTFPTT